jgi:hypothetical protein
MDYGNNEDIALSIIIYMYTRLSCGCFSYVGTMTHIKVGSLISISGSVSYKMK